VYQQCVQQEIGHQQFEFVTAVAEQRSQFSVSLASTCYKFDTGLTRTYRKVSHIRNQDFSPQKSVDRFRSDLSPINNQLSSVEFPSSRTATACN
jgi:hypothetical protein